MKQIFPRTKYGAWLAAAVCLACLPSAWAQPRPVVTVETVVQTWHPAEGTPAPLAAVVYVPSVADDPATATRRVTVFFNRTGTPSAWRAEWDGTVQIHVPAYGTVTIASPNYTDDELRDEQPQYDDAVALMARIEAQLQGRQSPEDSKGNR